MRNGSVTDTVAALMSVERMYKYEGLGNDFIVVERPAAQRDDAADAAWRARCATGTSVWAPTACCSWTRRRRPCTW
jgi:hypothetical protein